MDELVTGVHIEDIANNRFENLIKLIELRVGLVDLENEQEINEIKQLARDASILCMADLCEMLAPPEPIKTELKVFDGGKH